MYAILTTNNEEERNLLQPYSSSVGDGNDRKYAYVSVLIAHVAKGERVRFLQLHTI